MKRSVKWVKLLSALIAILIVGIALSINRQSVVSPFNIPEKESTQIQEKNLMHDIPVNLTNTVSPPSDPNLQSGNKTSRKGNTTKEVSDSGIVQVTENDYEGINGFSEADTDDFDRRKRFLAFWNSVNVPENDLKQLMNAGITRSPNFKELEEVVKTGRKVIPLFGAFDEDHTDYELRQRVGWYTSVFERIGWENIECIILRDEPYLKDLTINQMEVIIDEAKKRYEAPVAFTFTQNSIMNRPLPKGLDVVIINFYPFFERDAPRGYAQIHDYMSFKAEFDKMMRLIRQKSPGSAIAITAQVFGSESRIPWRIPEPETANWYINAISEHDDVVGLTFWGWESNRHTGLSENRELQQAWINALQNWK